MGNNHDTLTTDFSLTLDYANPQTQEDHEWMERTGLDWDTLCGAIEAMIFMSDRPVKIQKIRDQIDREKKLPLRAVHQGLSRLQQSYEQAHHGIRLVEVGEGFQFRTKATYAKFVHDLFKSSSLALSPVALEVLAIVAYRQPVSRADIDRIRGVESSHILRVLMDRRLVQVRGRSEDVGRPVVYGTTPEFLEMFNLTQIEDLPPEHELEALTDNQDVGDISDIKELVNSSSSVHENFHFDELTELDELAQTIKQVRSGTSFTDSIREEERKKGEAKGEEGKSAFELLEEFVQLSMKPDSQEPPPVPHLEKASVDASEGGGDEVSDEDEGEEELDQALDRALSKLEGDALP